MKKRDPTRGPDIIKQRLTPVPDGKIVREEVKVGLRLGVLKRAARAFLNPDFQKRFEEWYLNTYGVPYVKNPLEPVEYVYCPDGLEDGGEIIL